MERDVAQVELPLSELVQVDHVRRAQVEQHVRLGHVHHLTFQLQRRNGSVARVVRAEDTRHGLQHVDGVRVTEDRVESEVHVWANDLEYIGDEAVGIVDTRQDPLDGVPRLLTRMLALNMMWKGRILQKVED